MGPLEEESKRSLHFSLSVALRHDRGNRATGFQRPLALAAPSVGAGLEARGEREDGTSFMSLCSAWIPKSRLCDGLVRLLLR
jgi:hypothetical protein